MERGSHARSSRIVIDVIHHDELKASVVAATLDPVALEARDEIRHAIVRHDAEHGDVWRMRDDECSPGSLRAPSTEAPPARAKSPRVALLR
jgi:hypothetical protein